MRRRIVLGAVIAIFVASAHVARPSPNRAQRLEEAVVLARASEFEASLAIFDELLTADPSDARARSDYVVVLEWAGRYREALSEGLGLDRESAPLYTLDALGRAARHLKAFDLAEELFRRAHQRSPERWQSQLALGLVLADAGKLEEAWHMVAPLDERYPNQASVQLGLGYVLRQRDEHFEAMGHFGRAFVAAPEDKEAFRLWVLSIAELGATSRALAEGERWPEALTVSDWARIRGDRVAKMVNWGELPAPAEESRYREIDRALQLLDDEVRELEASTDAYRRARFDRILALRTRSSMIELVAAFETIQTEGMANGRSSDAVLDELPFYLLRAAGDAYLYLEQPNRAIELYRLAITKAPGDFNARQALFYALVAVEDFSAAFDVIDELVDVQPVWRSRPGLKHPEANPRRFQAELGAALARAFSDRLDEGQRRLESMLAEAPLNTDLRQELGTIYRWRGWPRRALAEHRRVAVVEPELLGNRIGEAQALLDVGNYTETEALVSELTRRYPEHQHVERLRRRWDAHHRWQLRLESSTGSSSGAQLGNRDLLFDTRVTSPPIGDRLRWFGRTLFSEADFPEGIGRYQRYGGGLELLSPGLLLAAEGSASFGGTTDAGISFGADWAPNDFLSLGGRFDSFSIDVPLRAHRQGIRGHALSLDAGYRFSELARIHGRIVGLDMSDGNRRLSARGSAESRLVNRPAYKATGILELYRSSNTLRGASYFNPRVDLGLGGTLVQDIKGYRRFGRQMIHRIVAHLGNYWQADFDPGLIGSLRYEHDWNLDFERKLRYGIGWASRRFDGDREDRLWLYATFDWRF